MSADRNPAQSRRDRPPCAVGHRPDRASLPCYEANASKAKAGNALNRLANPSYCA